MGDLHSKFLIVVKGLLFLLIVLTAAGLLFVQNASWLTALLLLLLIWASARFYYFLFYVLEKYVDPHLKYAGISALLRQILHVSPRQPDSANTAIAEEVPNDAIQHLLNNITDESCYHDLLDEGDEILPRLEAQYLRESSPEHRAAIVHNIWERRHPASLALLACALSDPAEIVWQEALNGIVTLGGEEAKAVLRAALLTADPQKTEWINEAITQIPALSDPREI